MKHQTIEQLQTIAEVGQGQPPMSRSERLERWAELLEQDPGRRLSTLHQTEYQSADVRARMRSDNSPFTVALKDPVLRSAGLKDDSYGEAKRFFDMSDEQLHEVICYCHFGATVNATTVARRIRVALTGSQPRIIDRLREAFVG